MGIVNYRELPQLQIRLENFLNGKVMVFVTKGDINYGTLITIDDNRGIIIKDPLDRLVFLPFTAIVGIRLVEDLSKSKDSKSKPKERSHNLARAIK